MTVTRCWYCGGTNLEDKGRWQLCSDCHASTVEVLKLGPPAMVIEEVHGLEWETTAHLSYDCPPTPRRRQKRK